MSVLVSNIDMHICTE